MKRINEQRGYALIVVLLTITIIGIAAPVIVTSLLNSSHQYQKAEKDIQLTKLAEMGVVYFDRTVHNYISAWEPPEGVEMEALMGLLLNDVGTFLNDKFPGSTLQFQAEGHQFRMDYLAMNQAENMITFDVIASVNGGVDERIFKSDIPIPTVNFKPKKENE
ncbi:type II secretion system protein [bacterium LRH843]|nr:type II secretion system protein [bacterium LRH843]